MCFRFPQVAWNFLCTGELPHHDHGHVDGLEAKQLPVDADVVMAWDDNLHMHDLKHTPRGHARGPGKGERQ